MAYTSKILMDVVDALSSLPSIGKKSAMRLAIHLASDNINKKEKIVSAIKTMITDLRQCRECNSLSDTEVCEICANPTRDQSLLCVVESVRDMIAIEETGSFRGLYHVLGGVISPLEGIGPENLEIDSLIARIPKLGVKEILMALSPTIDGETTIFYISRLLDQYDVEISTIARGVSFGGDLEYADEFTLGRSIKARLPYHQG